MQQTSLFSFTAENLEQARQIIVRYPTGRQKSAILPLLDLAQRQSNGWLPHAAIEYVAELLDIPTIRAYEVATFYTMFNLKKVGKYHIQVCGTTPCYLRGASEALEICKQHLKIGLGEISNDGLFSLSEVECLGACINAPVIQINDDYYEDMTPDKMVDLFNQLKLNSAN